MGCIEVVHIDHAGHTLEKRYILYLVWKKQGICNEIVIPILQISKHGILASVQAVPINPISMNSEWDVLAIT